MAYESPEMDIRWYETEDICDVSGGYKDEIPGDSGSGEDIFDDWDW